MIDGGVEVLSGGENGEGCDHRVRWKCVSDRQDDNAVGSSRWCAQRLLMERMWNMVSCAS